MKRTKLISLITSAIMTLTLSGCQSNETPSVPALSKVGGESRTSAANSAETLTSAPTSTEVSASAPNSADTSTSTPASTKTTSSAEESEPIVSSVESTTEDTPTPPNNDGQGELSGSVIVTADGRGMPMFGGGTGATYAQALNSVKEKVGKNVNVFSMIVPTQGSFYMPEGFTMASEWDCIENVNKQLFGIIPVDAYSALAAHVDEEIYARTDHHWMQLGAYYAAEEFVKTAQISVPFAPLSEYERHDIEGYLGSLYGYSNENANMGAHPETFTYYVAPNEYTTYYMNPDDTDFASNSMFLEMAVSSSYCIFMGGDMKVVHVETDVENQRKLLIIKDSYPNALVPCLTGSFEDIWTVDMRYLDDMQNFPHSISQIVKEQGITDVLFCMDTFSAVGENAENLPYIV